MTPLASKVARELTLPVKQRKFDDQGGVLPLFDQEMHCFEVSAVSQSVNKAMDLDNLWPDIESMLPGLFLPSPVTWLEQMFDGNRIACVVQQTGDYFDLTTVHDSERGPFSISMCKFRARGVLEIGERIEVDAKDVETLNDGWAKLPVNAPMSNLPGLASESVRKLRLAGSLMESRASVLGRRVEIAQAGLDILGAAKRLIGMTVLTIDLLNTPGLIGLRQRDPNRGLARALHHIGVGRYPLQAWSEVVLKHETRLADDAEHQAGTTRHKCLHFVRSHRRHYRSGHVSIIPAHWRGDPALGIKRTRYRAAA